MNEYSNRSLRPSFLFRRSLNSIIALVFVLSASSASAQLRKDYVGGYGEMTYHHYDDGTLPRLDISRFVFYFDHFFNSKWSFKSETEIEHVKIEGGAGGEIGVEQVYLDYHASDRIGWRVGLLVLPIGIMNQTHEPTSFYSVERPLFDQKVIPSTWREIGMGVYGNLMTDVSYQLLLTEGMRPSGITFEGTDGGKQEGSAGELTSDNVAGSDASHPAISAKLNSSPIPGMQIGVSTYIQRGSTQALLHSFAVADADMEYSDGPLRIRLEGAIVSTGDAADSSVPDRIQGGYVEVAYNVMPLLSPGKSELIPFVRYESYSFWQTNYSSASSSFSGAMSYLHNAFTAGVSFKPLDELILKADYRWTNTDSPRERRGFSLGAGYEF